MSTPILATKLYIPSPRANAVSRSRLLAHLNAGLHGKLTLISAPAGFGKTTLISQWIADLAQPVAWLSLDDRDNDTHRFLTYVIAAFQRIEADIGKDALSLLKSPQAPPLESILTTLINEITLLANDFILVLDDYHMITLPAIDEALIFLLDHLPPQMHLVITTRTDPPFPLARYRVRNQMTELRAADLRFTPVEATEFLNQVMNLTLTADDVEALDARTEGWIAGLQLAALSIRGRADVSAFIQAFAGNNRHIVAYLVEEVLQRQSEQIQHFLRQTAILDRLSRALCDAVTERNDSHTLLQTLEQSNLFLIPLDDKGQWYRYHHLFADVLQTQLMDVQPDQVPRLHQRASRWYEQHGLRSSTCSMKHSGSIAGLLCPTCVLSQPRRHGYGLHRTDWPKP
ncbi:MAG: hypothetical protein AAF639_40335 [Chloroflexota bacterium]